MVTEDQPQAARTAHETLFEYADQVRLIDWDEFSGARTTVLLTAGIAILSFVTGLSHLSNPTITLEGPLAPYVSSYATNFVRLMGIVAGFSLIAVAFGLQRRNRYAWYAAMVFIPVAAMQALLTGQATDIPLFLLPVITLPLVIYNREQFDQRIELSTIQITALAAILAVQVYGTVGAYALRAQYTGIKTVTDAFYYIVVTGTTVGYGDATPVTTEAKLFTLSVLIIGTAAFGAGLGSLVIPIVESKMSSMLGKMTISELALLEDHVLVLGYGELTEPLLEELLPEREVVVITDDQGDASDLRDRDINVLTDDPTDEEALKKASIGTARAVVAATEDDAQDALAVLAANRTDPDVRIVASANDQRNVANFEGAGADTVISPVVIGGRLLGRSVLQDKNLMDVEADLFGEDGIDAPTERETAESDAESS
jgi:voltage-gated potassium channel